MTDEMTTLLEQDDPPKNGDWVDVCDVLAAPTPEEIREGNELGRSTDVSYEPWSDSMRGFTASLEEERARAKARMLKQIMLKHGVPEVSIELQRGRPSSYGYWDAGFFVSEMSHHTVSRYSQTSRTPVLALCKKGRPDLQGPLCNGYGGWDLTYRIITFGYANHPGAGGSVTVPALTAGKFTIPKDSARRYSWGTEWEGGLDERDWDKILSNPRNGKSMTMREFMGRANAALEEFLEIHENAHLEHSTWTSRKIDRLGYTAAKGIAEKKKYKIVPAKPLIPKRKGRVDVSNVRREFLNFHEGRKTKRLLGIRHIRKALNARYDAGLKVNNRVDGDLVYAWRKHEKKVGVSGRPGVPDHATLSALAGKKYFKVVW